MFPLILIPIAIGFFLWIFRYYTISLLYYLLVRFEQRKIESQLLSSLRDDLIHERKKKIAGLEMMMFSSWEKGEEVQPRYEYFEELLGRLKNLVCEQRRNLMTVTKDIWLWGKLWTILRRIENTSKQKREKSDVPKLRKDFVRFQNLIDEVVEGATKKFSFALNEVVKESVKIVRIEKSQLKNIKIREQLDDVGSTVRFSYDKFKEWQRVLTNLIRNAVEAVETKQRVEGVAEGFSLRGGEETGWVKISTQTIHSVSVPVSNSVSVIIEDSGIGMDDITKSSFYKKGFTFGKEGGLGLGVSEESVQFINQYGNWQVESQKGIGTKITIIIDREKAQKAELILLTPKPFFRTKLAYGLSVLVLALIGLALLFVFDKYSRFWMDYNPAFVKLRNENTVVVEAKGGRFLWDRRFPQKIQDVSLVIADIDKDGENEVFIGTQYGFKETGHVFCFSFDGKELWRFTLGVEGIFGMPSKLYGAGQIFVRDFDLDGEKEIVVGAINYPYFPYQIAVLNNQGQLQSSYWHSGGLTMLLCDDIDGDGMPEIVFGGVNNRLRYSAVVGVLDYKTIQGQSPPHVDEVLPKGREKVYIKFPFVKGLGGENYMFSWVRTFMYTGKENGLDVYRADVHDHRGFIREFYLDKDLINVKRIIVSPDSRFLWQTLKKEGILNYDLTPEVIESWKQIEVWKNGVKVK